MIRLRYLLICSFSTICQLVTAQNIESIGKEKPLSLSGGVSLNQILYTAKGIPNRRDPYSYYASGNVNLSVYGWSVPLSFSYSNQNHSFQQPFNRYSMHPTYKFITAHVGYVSMSFSPYTVNGHIFLGAGVDVIPEEGKWKLSALYGRFLKAVEADTLNPNAQLPSFQRIGYGFKASYGDARNFVDFTMFHARDNVNSISFIPDSVNVLPQENLVMSVGAGKTFFKNFLLKGEIANSALSRDVRAPGAEQSNLLAKTGFLYTPRESSSFYNAYKASFDFQQEWYTIGIGYERIDPQYRTLGAYYFNNDLENITANATTSILEGRMNIAGSVGTQHDNLDKSKVSTMRRAVGSINVNYMVSQRLSFTGSYSTFQTYTNIRSQFVNINQLTPYDNLDTLRFTQITKNATLNSMYALSANKVRRQTLNLLLSYQGASDTQGDVPSNTGARFYNVNTAYAMSLVPQNLMISLSVNGTVNNGGAINTKTYGPVASISKSFFDRKLRTTLSSTYNNTYSNGANINRIINGRLSGTVSIKRKHNINLSTVMVHRQNRIESSTAKSFTEFTGTLGYAYAFGIK
jgi:hypothetical protein